MHLCIIYSCVAEQKNRQSQIGHPVHSIQALLRDEFSNVSQSFGVAFVVGKQEFGVVYVKCLAHLVIHFLKVKAR